MTCPHCKKEHSDWLSCDQASALGEAKEPLTLERVNAFVKEVVDKQRIIGYPSGTLVGEKMDPKEPFDRKAHMAKIRGLRKVAQK